MLNPISGNDGLNRIKQAAFPCGYKNMLGFILEMALNIFYFRTVCVLQRLTVPDCQQMRKYTCIAV